MWLKSDSKNGLNMIPKEGFTCYFVWGRQIIFNMGSCWIVLRMSWHDISPRMNQLSLRSESGVWIHQSRVKAEAVRACAPGLVQLVETRFITMCVCCVLNTVYDAAMMSLLRIGSAAWGLVVRGVRVMRHVVCVLVACARWLSG